MTANDVNLRRYYQLHARIYDLTRWSFLFGREVLLRQVAWLQAPRRILEIGCGTGRNMESMCRLFPDAEITGIDLSSAMLDQAWSRLRPWTGRVRLINEAYQGLVGGTQAPFDLIVCSYALSMFNPGWDKAMAFAKDDLADDGLLALVDFHRSSVPAFRQWMAVNHVRMDAHLLPLLREGFSPVIDRVTDAYGGLWQYLTFIGRKTSPTH